MDGKSKLQLTGADTVNVRFPYVGVLRFAEQTITISG